jgi:hypothetical protein
MHFFKQISVPTIHDMLAPMQQLQHFKYFSTLHLFVKLLIYMLECGSLGIVEQGTTYIDFAGKDTVR